MCKETQSPKTQRQLHNGINELWQMFSHENVSREDRDVKRNAESELLI